jgi:two-component system sensor histidine kinase KdpD
MLEGVDEETDRLTRMLTGLLDLTRIESGALEPQRDWHPLADLLEEAAASLRSVPGADRIQLEVDVEALGYFDFAQMHSVVANLLENALKYSPPGTPVEAKASAAGGSLSIEVRDHGPGVSRDERARIFEKFYRSRSNAKTIKGTGMGLAIVKGVVEAHGGRVSVEDHPEGGALFRVRLPQPAVPAARPEAARAAAR